MRFPVFAASLLLLTLTACESGPRHGRGGPPPSGEGAAAAIPVMEARETFFDDAISAQITLGPGVRPARGRPDGGGGDEGRGERPPGGMRVGGGGGMGAGGLPDGGGGGGRPPGVSSGGAPRMAEARMPAATIHLALTNTTAAPLTVEIYEFNSALGNFAVRPDTLTLAPGATASPDAMTTRLGIGGDEIPVTVELRVAGKADKRILTLKTTHPTPTTP